MLKNLGLLGTLAGVAIPQIAFALPTTIIILVPFLRAIPAELEDAARIDGASRLGFFWRILLPLSGPGLVTVGVLAFVAELERLPAAAAHRSAARRPRPCRSACSTSRPRTRRTRPPCSRSPRSRCCRRSLFFTLAQRRIVGGLTGAVKG